MFATVECKDAEGGLGGFIKDIFSLPEISVQSVKIPFGERFYKVTATEYRGQIPVAETVQKLKRLKGSVIFEVNFPCDESTAPLEYMPSEFTARLLFNSAVDYITSLDSEPLKSSVTVYDPSGFYAQEIDRIVPLFSKIKVHTEQSSLYEKTAQRLMEGYGASLVLCNGADGRTPESTVVICPGEVPFGGYFKGMLFTCAQQTPACGCVVRGYGVDLPGEYELLRPKGIGKMHFAAALYEKGGVSSLGGLSFSKLRLT